MASEALLSVRDLAVEFPTERGAVTVVDGVSFDIRPRETLAVVGESGSGKSVTALSIMRLLEYGGGRIARGNMLYRTRDGSVRDLVKGLPSDLRPMRGDEIAMIFQEPMTSLNPVFTIGDQISEAILLHQDMDRAAARAETLRLLEKVRIPEAKRLLDVHPHQLSGGMRQRVMIAMALSCRPGLLIADEPTTALDVTIQAQILRLMQQLQEEMGMAMMFITHDMGVVAEIADRVVVMYKGRKVEEGTTEEIFTSPQHPYTKSLLSAVPRLGAMKGCSLPARFPLVDPSKGSAASEAPQNTVKSAAEPLLSVRDLATRFDIHKGIFSRVVARVHAVEQVSFDIMPGETLSLVGESGCGKSTTGRTLMQLIEPTSGTIWFEGRDIAALSAAERRGLRRKIQYIFQDPYASLNPRLTVGFSIAEPIVTHGLASGSAVRERVAELLSLVGLLPEHAERYPHEFSGGQRQRISIARALASDPRLVIADESVAALDVSIRAQVINLLMDLQERLGVAFLFISHDMAVVERISHRVAVMYLGQIVEIGSRQDIFENPQHPYTRRLLSAVPIADPRLRSRDRELITGEVPSPTRRVGDEPIVEKLAAVSPTHFVAKHTVGAY
ncbi:ABC transporter ATP-binding protein [Microvirga rosea]|uniref:ABC transporter ATP-binding protein n=1 Tax=Microvirga rosea TaxID=2715425 RepID=UPI003872C95A